MKKLIFVIAATVLFAGTAIAERYVMITHSRGNDPFWPVVEKAGKDASAAIGADFEYNFIPTGTMDEMVELIEAAAATQPDGLVVSLPDADALGGVIREAVDSGIPVITMNSGLESSKAVGALMHVGQPEYLAGEAAGARAKDEGVTKGLCLNQESNNTALVDRCAGYFESLGQPLNMIDSSNDPAQIQTRTAAALQSDTAVDGILAAGPHVCEAAYKAIVDVGADIHLACFDNNPGVSNLIKEGKVAYTIDQQQYLQGYMPVIALHLYNNYAGMLPGANIPSGPGFVDSSNVEDVAAQAGINR